MAKIVQADKRGQIVIPKSIREELNLQADDAFWVHQAEGGIFLEKIESSSKKKPKVLK